MKKILAGIMSLALVMLVAPAYATNDLTVEVIPQSSVYKFSWDFGTVSDRDYCFSKTETWKDTFVNGDTSQATYLPLQHFNGTNFNAVEEGGMHYFTSTAITSDAVIPCTGSLNYPQTNIYTDGEEYYTTGTYMSFGEVFLNGTLNYLDEAIIEISNTESLTVIDNCTYDTFDHTKEVIVDRDSATLAVHDKSGETCIVVDTDLTNNNTYKSWFRTLPSLP